MFKIYFILLLLAHILGDFYIQTNNMSKKKEENIVWVLIHSICYWLTFLVATIPIWSFKVLLMVTVISIAHLTIDLLKMLYTKKIRINGEVDLIKERNIFFLDQILHLLCLVIVSYILTIINIKALMTGQAVLNIVLANFFETLEINMMDFIAWTVSLLIIHKPANIAISKLLVLYRPESKEIIFKRDNNAGRFIGTIERIIILIFISINQYSAIGLVLTAKSIARYDRITKEKDFAEYYLLGTLISTLIVIVTAIVI